MLKSKIHRATVTNADVDYEGSVTVDSLLLDQADILRHEQVHLWNVSRGDRLETYALPGPAGSGVVCVNGAAAHHARPGDLVILATFAEMEEVEATSHRPRIVFVDGRNRICPPAVEGQPHPAEVPGPLRRARG
jgi:aspartate 1-decarboxylase